MNASTASKSSTCWLFLVTVAFTAALPILYHSLPDHQILARMPQAVNRQLLYQGFSLFGTFVFLFILNKSRPSQLQQYFQKGSLKAKIKPAPLAGIKPKDGQNWMHYGINFAVVITLVTTSVIYLQHSNLAYEHLALVLPLSLLFALINSFVEESITRLGVVVSLKELLPDHLIALISGGLFGMVHYWGTPGGVSGVFLAFFLGWLLAKSILETKGIFGAWLIHFLQDIVIITAIMSST